MYFKRDEDCWEYGFITVHSWLETIFAWPIKGENRECFEYFTKMGGKELLNSFKKGTARFSYAQSLIFFQATDFISKIIIGDDIPLRSFLFSNVQRYSRRFKNLEEFENYYLDYSTAILDMVRKEFDKELELRGTLDSLLGIPIP